MKGMALGLMLVALMAGPVRADLAGDLAGRTLTTKGATVVLGADGTMSGKVGKEALAGSWSVRKGQFCRTITAPGRLAGAACQDAVLEGGRLTIRRADGSALVYKVK